MNRVQALLGYDKELLEKAKMHFAASVRNNEPMDAFFNGTFKQWQEDQSGKNFEQPYIIAWITYRKHEWMFARNSLADLSYIIISHSDNHIHMP